MSDHPTHLVIRTPAKVNLGLRVIGKRSDGFHEIETLFVSVTLFDELTFDLKQTGGATLTWEKSHADLVSRDLDDSKDNLILRAVRAFENGVGHACPVHIHLRKAIPIAAGLGGGSSDAAATLAALSRMFPLELSDWDLANLGSTVGSDVPFFLGPPAAIGRGRGERLSATTVDLTWWAILACPNVPSPTAAVYAALDLTYLPKMSDFPRCLEGDGFFAALHLFHNDLQDVVIRRIPEVARWLTRLSELGAEGAYVSGSGPAVFGIFRTRPDLAIVDDFRREGVQAFLVRPVDTPMSMVIGFS